MALRITCQPEFSDYLEAQLHHDRWRRLMVSLSLLALAVAFGLMGRGWWCLGLVVPYVLIVRPMVVRRSVRRDWHRTQSDRHGGGTFEFDDQGMHVVDGNGQRDTTPWSCFQRLHESPNLFLVYLSPRVYIYFPKRALGAPEQKELRKALREHIGPRLPEGRIA